MGKRDRRDKEKNGRNNRGNDRGNDQGRRRGDKYNDEKKLGFWGSLRQETRNSIIGIMLLIVTVILALAPLGKGGKVGTGLYDGVHFLFGIGYYVVPLLCVLLAINFFRAGRANMTAPALVAGPFFILSFLGILSLYDKDAGTEGLGGFVGYYVMSPSVYLFEPLVTAIVLFAVFLIAILILFDVPLHLGIFGWIFSLFARKPKEIGVAEDVEVAVTMNTPLVEEKVMEGGKWVEEESKAQDTKDSVQEEPVKEEKEVRIVEPGSGKADTKTLQATFAFNALMHEAFVPPPLSLLSGDRGKAGYGDVKANANTIRRTLQNFGVDVEMDEVVVGPSVTRYSLKPAENVRLSKIVALQRELEYALALAPIRIEAPIPGKSLVGVEVPNSQKSTVGLASLLSENEWASNPNPLYVALGKGISGTAHFMNIAKMPHVLVAGATGSGKSVTIHTLITSLLYRNSPEQLRLIMVDPKRVELTLYNGIPHLLTPVIIEPKKTILTLKWAAGEMDRRYSVLQEKKVRDIGSYHKNVSQPAFEAFQKAHKEGKIDEKDPPQLPEPMPYIVIVIDELADIMQAYPRELESAIVRLAQMSRAVGIHLVLSTQRPSVNVITGLIKANVPARIALQVASNVDSRTILDMAGAENLLGAGDMLFLSAELPKPVRLQSAFISETEVKNVVKFLKDHYEGTLGEELFLTGDSGGNGGEGGDAGVERPSLATTMARAGGLGMIPEESLNASAEEEDDMYEEAKRVVLEDNKASTSHLQRRLGLGYSRAAKIMDALERNGVIGPGSGAKPREILMGRGNAAAAEEGFGREE